MSRSGKLVLAAFILFCGCFFAFAQEAKLAPEDIAFSHKMYHLVAWVELEVRHDKVSRYQYDRYPDRERIRFDGSDYARVGRKKWRKSKDWGNSGTAIEGGLQNQLDAWAEIVDLVFVPPKFRDKTQGATVWRFVTQSAKDGWTYFTYERSRERPHPDGVYPRFTFMKADGDIDGKLLLQRATGQLRQGDALTPYAIRFDYLIPFPAGTKVEVRTAPGKLEKMSRADAR